MDSDPDFVARLLQIEIETHPLRFTLKIKFDTERRPHSYRKWSRLVSDYGGLATLVIVQQTANCREVYQSSGMGFAQSMEMSGRFSDRIVKELTRGSIG
jgi:hypothetical protein